MYCSTLNEIEEGRLMAFQTVITVGPAIYPLPFRIRHSLNFIQFYYWVVILPLLTCIINNCRCWNGLSNRRQRSDYPEETTSQYQN